jgi:hypothetical protein
VSFPGDGDAWGHCCCVAHSSRQILISSNRNRPYHTRCDLAQPLSIPMRCGVEVPLLLSFGDSHCKSPVYVLSNRQSCRRAVCLTLVVGDAVVDKGQSRLVSPRRPMAHTARKSVGPRTNTTRECDFFDSP